MKVWDEIRGDGDETYLLDHSLLIIDIVTKSAHNNAQLLSETVALGMQLGHTVVVCLLHSFLGVLVGEEGALAEDVEAESAVLVDHIGPLAGVVGHHDLVLLDAVLEGVDALVGIEGTLDTEVVADVGSLDVLGTEGRPEKSQGVVEGLGEGCIGSGRAVHSSHVLMVDLVEGSVLLGHDGETSLVDSDYEGD